MSKTVVSKSSRTTGWLKKSVEANDDNLYWSLPSRSYREWRFIRRFHRISWGVQELSFRSLKKIISLKTQPPGHHSPHPYTPSPVYIEGGWKEEKKIATKHPLPFPASSPSPHLFSPEVPFVPACTAVPRATCQLASHWMNARALPAFIFGSLSPSTWRSYVIFLGGGSRWHGVYTCTRQMLASRVASQCAVVLLHSIRHGANEDRIFSEQCLLNFYHFCCITLQELSLNSNEHTFSSSGYYLPRILNAQWNSI